MSMRTTLLLSCLTLALVGCASSSDDPKPPSTMQVDLQQYQGTWYELARLPMFFQRNCVQSEARYSLREDGRIGVDNRCREAANGMRPKASPSRSKRARPTSFGSGSTTGSAAWRQG